MNMHNIQLEYAKQFWEAYPDVRKIFMAQFNENHEFSGELIKYNDEDFINFFIYFREKGYLSNTQFLIMADHGQHFIVSHTPIYPDDSRFQENYLPLLIFLTPKDIPAKNLAFLKNNQ